MVIRPVPYSDDDGPGVSYVAWVLIGLLGGSALSSIVGLLLYAVRGPRGTDEGGLILLSLMVAGIAGGIWVARERRRGYGSRQLAYSSVLSSVGGALLGAWTGAWASLAVRGFLSIEHPSSQDRLLVFVLVLAGAVVGLRIARNRRGS